MSRRQRGEYKHFIVRKVTVKDRDMESEKRQYWGGPYTPSFYDYVACGHGYSWLFEAETDFLLLVAKQPELIGQVYVTTLWVPETEFEKKARLKAARERRAATKKLIESWKAEKDGSSKVSGSTPGSTPSDTGNTSKP